MANRRPGLEETALLSERLERKDRAELAAIVEALGGKASSRAKKTDLVDLVLELAGASITAEGDHVLIAPRPFAVSRGSELMDELLAVYEPHELLILADAVQDVLEPHSGRLPETFGWDVASNEVAVRLGGGLVGIEPFLDQNLDFPAFRIALAEWRDRHAKGVGPSGTGEASYAQAAIDALALLDAEACARALGELALRSPDLHEALRRELPLGCANMGDAAVLVWRVLDERSPVAFRPTDRVQLNSSDPGSSAAQAAAPTLSAPARALTTDKSSKPLASASVKGRTLEHSFRDILATLFDLENASEWKLRKQSSGSQFGFDVSFRAPDLLHRSLSLFECKNYTSEITLKVVSDKLLQAEEHWADTLIDHWILVSPHTDPVNELDNLLESWNYKRRFPFAVQVWSPTTGIEELFRLDRDLYAAVYGKKSPRLSEDRRLAVIEDFRRRLQPPLRVPRCFADYVVREKPVLLPTDDSSWPSLLGQHIQRTALTEAGAPASTSLLTTVSDWCLENRGRSRALLLMADFGEGKSFFTFELCADLMCKYRNEPARHPLPLRFTLRDFRRLDSPKEYLELQLAYYGATLSDFGDLRNRASIVVILDGIDEMSVRQDGQAITENLQKLQELLHTIADIPVVLASRPHFFESVTHRTRFYDRLRRPLVYRLGQPSRAERLDHLHAYATATGTTEKLRRVKTLYDPIGLSAKVLFLEMLKATLPELPDDNFSETVLYDTYIDSALRRKIELLDDAKASVSHDVLVESLRDLLNAVAVRVHQSGEGTVDLRAFHADESNLAETLWHVAQTAQVDELPYDLGEDATARVGMRSLLKRVGTPDDPADEWKVEFSHRSLKEFFVARAVLSAIESPTYEPDARRLLRDLHLEPVILHFLAQFPLAEPDTVRGRLRSLTRSAIVGNDNHLLGGNSLACFAALGGRACTEDWSGLELDTALLGGADLHRCAFKASSLRWAVLDNTDLSNADLRSADLTGVRLEETSGVVALTRGEAGTEVIVLYDDCSVRRWRVHEGSRSTCDTVIASLPSGYSELAYMGGGYLLLLGPVGASIWSAPREGDWSQLAEFPSDNRIRRLAVNEMTMAVVSEDEVGRLFLSSVSLASGETRWTRPCSRDAAAVAGDLICGVGDDEAIRLFSSISGQVVGECAVDADIRAVAIRDGDDSIQLGAVTAGGDILLVDVASDGTCAVIATGSETHDTLATSASWIDGGLASGGGGRRVVVSRPAGSEMLVDRTLQRDLRCGGAKVAGLLGDSERSRLVTYGARE